MPDPTYVWIVMDSQGHPIACYQKKYHLARELSQNRDSLFDRATGGVRRFSPYHPFEFTDFTREEFVR